MDSLRYWVQEMHVDGFRFDLAPVLGRGDPASNATPRSSSAVAQDPVLAGRQADRRALGHRPRRLPAWGVSARLAANGTTDSATHARASGCGGECTRGEFALRLCASSRPVPARRRGRLGSRSTTSSSHDGFTLADLVSYDHRHNQANGEDNRDGHGHNLSWNCGCRRRDRRRRGARAAAAAAARAAGHARCCAQGTPMLAAGDELGHSQGGNNNPYCQDNATTWIDWAGADDSADRLHRPRCWRCAASSMPLDDAWYTGLHRRRRAGRPGLAARATAKPRRRRSGATRGRACWARWSARQAGGASAHAAAGQRRQRRRDLPHCPPATGGRCSTATPTDGRRCGSEPKRRFDAACPHAACCCARRD